MRIPLVCPRCRRSVDGHLVRAQLRMGDGGLVCPACQALHPVVDGVPILFRDLDAWLEHRRGAVLARRDLPPAVLERLGAPRSPTRGYEQVGGELVAAVRELVAGLEGEVLDLGCGVGWHGRTDVVGVDQDFDMCRAYPGPAVCGDAADPPFDGDRFDAVLLLNILDSCQHSGLVLAQADALLRPGGSLLIACAYAFDDRPEARFTPEQLRQKLIGYEVLLEEEALTWRLQVGPRRAFEYSCELLHVAKAPRQSASNPS